MRSGFRFSDWINAQEGPIIRLTQSSSKRLRRISAAAVIFGALTLAPVSEVGTAASTPNDFSVSTIASLSQGLLEDVQETLGPQAAAGLARPAQPTAIPTPTATPSDQSAPVGNEALRRRNSEPTSSAEAGDSSGASLLNDARGPVSSKDVLQISLATNDIVYDPLTQMIYASVPSSAGSIGNSITSIDPSTGAIGSSVFVGSEPGKLALSDNGQYLYVALDGAAAVRRFDIASQTAGLQFSLGSDAFSRPYYVEDIEVLPGDPEAVAVSRKYLGSSPRHAGVAVYDNGVQRPTETAGHTGSNVIEFSDSAPTLYGYNNETTEYGFRRMSVDASGVSVVEVAGNLISGFRVDIEFDDGLIYTTSGRVIDAEALTVFGTFSAGGLVEPDSVLGRVFFLTGTGSTRTLLEFDQSTFILLGTLDIPEVSGTSSSLIRQGVDGLAFRTSSDQVFLIGDYTAPEGTNLVMDGGFEQGSPNPVWNEFSTNFGTPLCTTALCGFGGGTGPHSGGWWVWFGGLDVPEIGSVTQDVIIPAGSSELSFWLEIPSGSGTGRDILQVSIDSSLLFEVTDAATGLYPAYTKIALDVSSFGNCAAKNLSFYSETSGVGLSNFFVDDVVLELIDPATFCDLPTFHWAWQFVEAIATAGLTAGYPDGTYRPDNPVTRAEMAVFLKKGIHGSTYFPPTPDGSHPFNDIAGHWAEAWIEDLFDEGFTSGFPDGTYRPDNQVTRAEMAVFLKKAIHGSAYTSPTTDGSHPFSDIAGHWAEAWIEDLYDEGITSGFPDGTYRPENQVTRAEMAVFLVNAFSLALP